MKKIRHVSVSVLFSVLAFGASAVTAFAVVGEGTATIDGFANATVEQGISQVYTVVLTVGASGITADAENPTFTVPAGFTAPTSTPVATIGDVLVDGDWFVAGGATCVIDSPSVGLTTAVGQVITVDVTTTCTVGPGGKITLTYKGKSDTAGVVPFDIGTNDVISYVAVKSISLAPNSATLPTITVTAAATSGPVWEEAGTPNGTLDAGEHFFQTIQSAIDAGTTVSGDTIFVSAGNYTEQINITKAITLTGAGKDITHINTPEPSAMTIHDAFGSKSPTPRYTVHRGANISVVRIASSDVTFQGFNVNLGNKVFWDVKGSFASDTTYSRSTGILVDHVETVLGTPDTFTNINIQNNKVDGMLANDKGDAIKALGNATVTIHGNTIYAHGESGISAVGSEDYPSFLPVYHPTVTATSNIIYGGDSSRTSNFLGIGYWVGATGTSSSNTIYNTPNNYGYALNSWTTMPVSFTHNIITTDGGGVGGYGAQLYQSSALIFSNNTIENQGLVGGILMNPTVTISGNTITNSTDGFLIDNQTSGSVRFNNNSTTGTAVGHNAVMVGGINGADSGTIWGTWGNPSTITVDASNNWWGNASGPTHAGNVGGTGDAVSGAVTFTPYYTDSLMSHLKGIITTSIDNDEASTTISIATTQSGLDSNGGAVTGEIPQGTVVTGNSSWDGSISAPTPPATPVTVAVSGFNSSVISAFTVGSSDSDLTFDKAVRLVFAGQASTHVGWYNHAGVFTEITADCAVTGGDVEASQTTNLGAGASCKMDVGGNLIVWTKHFSTFVTYTQTAIPAPTSGGGASGGGGAFPVGPATPATPAVPGVSPAVPAAPAVPVNRGEVLGESAFNFNRGLALGSRGDDVTELQNRLTAEGVYFGPITGYFGSLTAKGVKNFQKKYGISQVGVVGPQTRARLNSGVAVGTGTGNEIPGCALGNKFNTTTGLSCLVQASSGQGCAVGNKFNTNTGQSCPAQ